MNEDVERGGVDLHALTDVYLAQQRRVYALCLSRLHDPAAAEDAAQETFLRVAHRLDRVDLDTLPGFLAGVARNVCREHVRRGVRGRNAHAAVELDEADDAEVVATDRRIVQVVWAQLSQRERLLLLHRFAGFSYEEIGQRLRLSLHAVRMGVMRARQHARRLLDGSWATLAAWRTRRARGRRRAARAVGGWGRAGAAVWTSGQATVALAVATGVAAAGLVASLADAPRAAVQPDATLVSAAAVRAPRSVHVEALTVSPQRVVDRTVYAAGETACASGSCPALLRTRDDGRTWEGLPAAGYAGGRVLPLPAAGAASGSTLVATGPAGLQRSDDGGRSFHTVVPRTAPVAAAAVRGGGALVALGTDPLLLYDVRSGALTRGAALPHGVHVDDMVATGDGGALLVAVRGGGETATSVLRCAPPGPCRVVLRQRGSTAIRLVSSPEGDVVAALAAHGVWTASGDGTAWHAVGGLGAGEVGPAALTETAAGAIDRLAVSVMDAGRSTLLISTRGGPLAPVSTSAAAVVAMAATDTGTILAVPATPGPSGGWEVDRSTDGAVTWRVVST